MRCTGKNLYPGFESRPLRHFLGCFHGRREQPWASGESGRGFRGKAGIRESSLLRVLRPSRADLRAKRPSVSFSRLEHFHPLGVDDEEVSLCWKTPPSLERGAEQSSQADSGLS